MRATVSACTLVKAATYSTSRSRAEAALEGLRETPGGEGAEIVGEVSEQAAATVLVTTPYGGSRVVNLLVGDPLPRIC